MTLKIIAAGTGEIGQSGKMSATEAGGPEFRSPNAHVKSRYGCAHLIESLNMQCALAFPSLQWVSGQSLPCMMLQAFSDNVPSM